MCSALCSVISIDSDCSSDEPLTAVDRICSDVEPVTDDDLLPVAKDELYVYLRFHRASCLLNETTPHSLFLLLQNSLDHRSRIRIL